jgi:hypothetical protein
MILLLSFFFLLSIGNVITISVVTENGIQNAKGQLSTAYLQYLYSPYSNDQIECLLNGQLVLPKTSARNKQLILQTIQGLSVTPSGNSCSASYYLIPRDTSMFYLIVDKNPCDMQQTIQQANNLKMRGIKIFPIGVGTGVWENTLAQVSGPCMGNSCLPGWNYIKI